MTHKTINDRNGDAADLSLSLAGDRDEILDALADRLHLSIPARPVVGTQS